MRKIKAILILMFIITGVTFGQESSTTLPSIDLKTITGETFNTSEIKNDGPILLSFWATWCKPCIKELMAIDENYIDWQDETGFKVVAVSIDDTKSQARVTPFINSRGWEYDILLDPNSDFKRAMNVTNIPHSFILDKDGNVVWQHVGYAPGDEEEVYEIIKKLANGEEIEH